MSVSSLVDGDGTILSLSRLGAPAAIAAWPGHPLADRVEQASAAQVVAPPQPGRDPLGAGQPAAGQADRAARLDHVEAEADALEDATAVGRIDGRGHPGVGHDVRGPDGIVAHGRPPFDGRLK
jgi:hypothetical protein